MISIMYKTFIFLTLFLRKKAYQLRGLYSKQMQYVSAGIFQKINMHWLITVHFLQTRRLLTMLLWIFIKHHLFFVTARIRILFLADLRRNSACYCFYFIYNKNKTTCCNVLLYRYFSFITTTKTTGGIFLPDSNG